MHYPLGSQVRLTFVVFLLLALRSADTGATVIVEMSQTLDFSGLVVNSSGQSAYFATPLDPPPNLDFEPQAIHRDGALWVAPSGVFKEISGPLLINDIGTVVFGGFQGEFFLPDVIGGDEGGVEEVGGVYRGANPALPEDNQTCVVSGDSLWSCGNSLGGTPVGYAANGDFLLSGTPTGPRVRFPYPRACPQSSTEPDDVFAPPHRRGQDINGTLIAGFFDDPGGTYLALEAYPNCGGPEYDDDALRDATRNVFRSVSSLKLGDSAIYVQALRNTPNGPVAGLYEVSLSGAVTTLLEPDAGSKVRPRGITKSGLYFYLDQLPGGETAFFSSASGTPLLAPGHQIGDFILRDCSELTLSDSGLLGCIGQLRSIITPSLEFNAVILADGGTDFPPDPDEPEPELIFWNEVNNAVFSNADSWDPPVVPDSDLIAVFGTAGGGEIDFESQTANSRQLRVDRGFFRFLNGSYQLNTGSAAEPSLVFAPSEPEAGAALTIADNHQLQTRYAVIDNSGLVGGLSAMFLDSDRSIPAPQNRWDNSGSLVVDGNLGIGWTAGLVTESTRIGSTPGAWGAVTISSSGGCAGNGLAANLGVTWVGDQGEGQLIIEDNCIAEVDGERIIGARQGSLGVVRIDQGSWEPTVLGSEARMTIGQAGSGRMSVNNGGSLLATALTLGQTASGRGELSVEASSLGASALIVANAGFGELAVLGSANVLASSLEIGKAQGAFGNVLISGTPPAGSPTHNLEVLDEIYVGIAGTGELDLVQGRIRSTDGFVGVADAGLLRVFDTASWELEGDLHLGTSTPGSDPNTCDGDEQTIGLGILELLSDGQTSNVSGQVMTISGPDSAIMGTGLISFANHVVTDCAVLSPGNSPGTLSLDGNLELTGAVLVIEVDGTAAGQFDVLKVSGSVNMNGGTVRFVFDEFFPRQGDTVRFLESSGAATTLVNMSYEYLGAIPGFDFSVTTDSAGNLLFTALNDAQGEEIFRSGFE